MKYRLLAVDMDDTLLKADLQISEHTVDKIRQVEALGVKVLITTGRMFRSIVPYMRQLGLTGPAIAYNGGMVRRVDVSTPDVHHPVPVELARAIAKVVEESGSQLNAYLDDWLYVRKRTPEVLRYMEKTGVDSTEVGLIHQFLTQEPTKLLVIQDDLTEVEILRTRLVQEFGEVLSIVKSKPNFIEITAKGVTKGKALAEMTAKLGISREEVIAIGDGQNDLSMIEWAGLGVAVANATPELKAAADYVTTHPEEEGVVEVIDQFILSKEASLCK